MGCGMVIFGGRRGHAVFWSDVIGDNRRRCLKCTNQVNHPAIRPPRMIRSGLAVRT